MGGEERRGGFMVRQLNVCDNAIEPLVVLDHRRFDRMEWWRETILNSRRHTQLRAE